MNDRGGRGAAAAAVAVAVAAPAEARLRIGLPRALEPHARDIHGVAFARELLAFAWQQACSCIFPLGIFAGLAVARLCEPAIARYDAMLVLCVLMQAAMVRLRLETLDELKVICVFHVLGLGLELWKVHHGSWAYPGAGWTKVAGVPLYSGFMYASIASYMCQAWRRLRLEMLAWPPGWQTAGLGAAIYLNFFANAYLPDARWPIIAAMVAVFLRTSVRFRPNGSARSMPLIAAFFLIAAFIWLGENLGTYLDAWRYPHQRSGWHAVHLQKLSSWFLLVIVSLVLVAHLKRVKAGRATP